MGYLVKPSGRLHLPESDDVAAAVAVQAAMSVRRGWFTPDAPSSNHTLADMATNAGASIVRDGDWIEFGYDDEGDPKWSDQAEAFYVAIASFVRSGVVQIEGEDGATWSYTYDDGQVVQRGGDGSAEPFGKQAERR